MTLSELSVLEKIFNTYLVEVEELSNLVGSLGSKSSVNDGVGEAGDFVVTLSDNEQVQI